MPDLLLLERRSIMSIGYAKQRPKATRILGRTRLTLEAFETLVPAFEAAFVTHLDMVDTGRQTTSPSVARRSVLCSKSWLARIYSCWPNANQAAVCKLLNRAIIAADSALS